MARIATPTASKISTASSIQSSKCMEGPEAQMRRRPRPGVTAAPITAALATGAGPGVTARVTTAALATGAPTTPTRPTRAARMGISGSLGGECLVGLDGGEDGLDRDAAVGDELSAGATRGRGEGRRPRVFVDDDAGDASGVHGGCEVLDVFFGEQLGELGLERPEWSEVLEVGELEGVDGP